MPHGGVSPPSSIESPLPPFVLATFRDHEAEWEAQRDALQALAAAAKSDAVARPNSLARHEFLRQLRDVGQPLAMCIAAPRSTLVREASQCIIQCVEVFGPLFVDAVGNTLARPILDKTGVSIAVIRESAFEAGKALFEHGVTGFSPDIVNMLCEYVQNSKLSSLKRAAAAQFLGMVLVEDCLAGLEPIMSSIQKAIVRGCQDSDERVRALSRENWRKLEILDRSSARQLLNEMPANTTALIAREKGGSPWSDKSAGGRFEQRKSPGSPGRTFKFAPQRYPSTAKRLHPQRITSESAVESTDISPSTAIRRAVTSHTTTTSSLPTSRVGRTQRTAVRLPRPQVRAVDPGSHRPGLPPRPISIPKVRDGMPQAGSVLNRQFGRPVSRPICRPARRSMALNPKNILQGSPPGGVTDHREKVRQSVPAALARAPIVEEQAISIASPGSSSSSQSEAKKDEQDTEFFTPSPISRAAIKAGRLPGSPRLEESTHSGADKPHSTAQTQTQGIPRTLSGDSFVTAHEERKSLSFRETAMELASRMYRSLQGTSESTEEAQTPSPKRDPVEADAEQPSCREGEESDFASLSSIGSADRGTQEPSPKAVNSPANPRKARLSFILNMNASPPQFTVPQPHVALASVTQGCEGIKTEAVNVPWNDPTNAKQQPTAPLQPSAYVSATSKYPNEHIESMSDEIELLMSMQSLTEEAEKPTSFGALIPTTTPVVAKSPEPVSTSICTTEGESSREGESSVGNVTVEDVVVFSSPDKPKEAGNDPEGNLVLTGKIAIEKENARPASATSDATVVLKKDPDQDAEKDTKQISKLETEEVSKAPKVEERKPLRPSREMASIAPSNAPRPKTMPSPTQPAEPPKREDVPAKRPHNATALPPRWKTNKASIARTTARRSMMFDLAIQSQDSDPQKKREARKGDVTRRLPQRVPNSSSGVAKKVGRPPYMAPAPMSRKPRPPLPGARRSLMPGTKLQPPASASHVPRVRRSLMPGGQIQPAPGVSDAKAMSRPPSVGKARPASTGLPPQNGKKVEKSKFATMRKTGAASNRGMPGPSRRVAEWLKEAKRIKNGAWEERCKALKGFGEACQKLDGERISMGLADECIGVLGEYIRQGHHRVISEALDGLFFLLLCSEGSSHMLQRALEKREDVLRRTLGLMIAGNESARLAAGRVMHSFEVQFSPEVMVGLIMRAMNQGGGGGVVDVRVSKMGCEQLGKAFERAAISGEGFVWKTGLLESVLKTLEGLCGHRRVGVRRAGDGVVEQVRESLPERAFELACEKYGVKFGEGK